MRLDGRIDEGRLTNSPFPRMARLQGTQASECSSRGWVREARVPGERLRRWCGGVDINTFEGTTTHYSRMSCVAWWRRLRGIQRGLRMALRETKEGGIKSIIGRRTRHLRHLVFSSRLHSPSNSLSLVRRLKRAQSKCIGQCLWKVRQFSFWTSRTWLLLTRATTWLSRGK